MCTSNSVVRCSFKKIQWLHVIGLFIHTWQIHYFVHLYRLEYILFKTFEDRRRENPGSMTDSKTGFVVEIRDKTRRIKTLHCIWRPHQVATVLLCCTSHGVTQSVWMRAGASVHLSFAFEEKQFYCHSQRFIHIRFSFIFFSIFYLQLKITENTYIFLM